MGQMAFRGRAPPTPLRLAPAEGGSTRLGCRPTVNPAKTFLGTAPTRTSLLLDALQVSSRAARGSAGADIRGAVAQHLGGMAPAQQAAEMADACSRRRLNPSRLSGMSQFALCMERKGTQVMPVTVEKVSTYLSWCVLEKQTVSSHTLQHVLGNLRGAATTLGEWQVNSAGELRLKEEMAVLQRVAPSATRVTYPVPTSSLLRTATRLGVSQELGDVQANALLCVGMGTLARGTEMGGTGGVLWQDLTTDERGLGFDAMYTKRGKHTAAPRPRAFPHMPPQLAALCPARALTRYKEALRAADRQPLPATPVWIDTTATARAPRPLTVEETTAIVKRELARDKADVSRMDAHWARYAGNSVLTFDLRLYDVADILGDWAPAASGQATKNVRKRVYTHPTLDQQMNLARDEVTSKHPGGVCCQPAVSRKRKRENGERQ
jgi:hypothetical protein